MSNIGWISLHRQILDSWIWEDKPFSYGQAWTDMILVANHEDNNILFEGKIITIPRGAFHTSILKLADRYGWNRKKTTKFLDLLENQKMVTTERTTHGTTITIVNYDKFQTLGTTDGTTNGTAQGTTKGQPRDTNNNVNNDNNIINNIISLEPDKSAPNPSGILIILNDKSFYDVPLEKITMWKATYPAVDVEQELRKMGAWCDSNPTRRKTRRGVEKFINNWLSRTQDSGGTKGQKGVSESVGNNTYNTDYEWECIKRAIAEAGDSGEPREKVFG